MLYYISSSQIVNEYPLGVFKLAGQSWILNFWRKVRTTGSINSVLLSICFIVFIILEWHRKPVGPEMNDIPWPGVLGNNLNRHNYSKLQTNQ